MYTIKIMTMNDHSEGFEAASSQSTATDIALMSVSDEATVTDSDSDRYRAFNLSLDR